MKDIFFCKSFRVSYSQQNKEKNNCLETYSFFSLFFRVVFVMSGQIAAPISLFLFALSILCCIPGLVMHRFESIQLDKEIESMMIWETFRSLTVDVLISCIISTTSGIDLQHTHKNNIGGSFIPRFNLTCQLPVIFFFQKDVIF